MPAFHHSNTRALTITTSLFCGALLLPSCSSTSPMSMGAAADPCRSGAFANAGSLALISSPKAGDVLASGSTVTGCGRAFESTLNYRLTARDGSVLASGFTQAGGVDGPAPFSFTISYTTATEQLGHLEVFEEDASDGEGFPPSRTVIPVRLVP